MNNKVDSFRKKISKLRKKICDLENELDELHNNACDIVIYTNLTLRIAELKAENKFQRETIDKVAEEIEKIIRIMHKYFSITQWEKDGKSDG